MANKKQKQRTDAERRARQCERLSRLIRVLRLITGPGRWDAAGIAKELECSPRTVHRILQVLSMGGVPWFFDQECQAYKVRPGFRFSPLDADAKHLGSQANPAVVLEATHQLLEQGERFLESLRQFSRCLEGKSGETKGATR